MERQAVQSSNVKSIGYDPQAMMLEIEFHSGGIYQYSGVRPDHHATLMACPSIGAHVSKHIRGKYETTLVKPKGKG
jgi:hypothetical protein